MTTTSDPQSSSLSGAASASSSAMISVEALTSGYYGRKVIDGISFAINEPGIYVVLGSNGAGKTTLFRTLAGILKPYSGKVAINGAPSESSEARHQIDYLTHIDGIPDGMRVAEALGFYANVQGAEEADVNRVISLLGLEDLKHRYFSQLSQGQKKRVSIARIFLKEKSVYLLDEPTSNLDPKIAREIRELVLALSRDRIVLYSSHNLYEAREIGNEVLVINHGKLAMFGRIDEIRTQKYVVGVRMFPDAAGKLEGYKREGDYYLIELSGPEEVPKTVADLVAKGVKIREIKEMQNPLEELFSS